MLAAQDRSQHRRPAIRISVAILTHNSAGHIVDCIDAVMRQTRKPDEIIVIDNASEDGTPELVAERYPGVIVYRNAVNSGCSGGRNEQIRRSTHRYVMIVDDDAFLAADCIEVLAQSILARADASIWAPRICYEQDRERIQFDGGGNIHFMCEAVLRNPDRIANECRPPFDRGTDLGFQGGVAFMLDKVAAIEVGGYDETYFFGRTDGEFSFRLVLLGKVIAHAPEAAVFHRVKVRGMAQVQRQIRNRWTLMLHTFSASTLIVILPALLVYELALVVLLTVKGHFRQYFSAWRQIVRMLPTVWEKRKDFTARKTRHDRDVLVAGLINMRADLKSSWFIRIGLAVMTWFFAGYWYIAKQVLRITQR